MSAPDAGQVHLEVDRDRHLARLTIDRPARKNAYDPPMREQMREYLDEVADDDDVKVLILRGADGVFTTGADMANAYAWYGGDSSENKDGNKGERRPSQRRRLAVDRVTRMPADGLAIAKTGFNLVEQTQGYVGEEATGFLMHAFSTNLRFEADEFNFVKERARHGTSAAFKLRDEHFSAPSDGE